MYFISMYRVLNKHSEYIYFYIPKSITLYALLLVFKIVRRLPCILKTLDNFGDTSYPGKETFFVKILFGMPNLEIIEWLFKWFRPDMVKLFQFNPVSFDKCKLRIATYK